MEQVTFVSLLGYTNAVISWGSDCRHESANGQSESRIAGKGIGDDLPFLSQTNTFDAVEHRISTALVRNRSRHDLLSALHSNRLVRKSSSGREVSQVLPLARSEDGTSFAAGTDQGRHGKYINKH